MAGKRKRGTASPAPTPKKTKRGKADSARRPQPVHDDKEYKIRSIRDETKTQYLIEWEDDSDTGTSYEPTWEPKQNANQFAIDDWEQQKAQRPAAAIQARSRRTPDRKTSKLRLKTSSKKSQVVPGFSRGGVNGAKNSRAKAQAESEAEPELELEPEPEIDDSQSPLFEPESITGPSRLVREATGVRLSQPPSSYQAGAYERFSPRPGSTGSTPQSDWSTPLSSADPIAEVPQTTSAVQRPSSASSSSAEVDGHQQPTQDEGEKSVSQIIPDSQSQESSLKASSAEKALSGPLESPAHPATEPDAATAETEASLNTELQTTECVVPLSDLAASALNLASSALSGAVEANGDRQNEHEDEVAQAGAETPANTAQLHAVRANNDNQPGHELEQAEADPDVNTGQLHAVQETTTTQPEQEETAEPGLAGNTEQLRVDQRNTGHPSEQEETAASVLIAEPPIEPSSPSQGVVPVRPQSSPLIRQSSPETQGGAETRKDHHDTSAGEPLASSLQPDRQPDVNCQSDPQSIASKSRSDRAAQNKGETIVISSAGDQESLAGHQFQSSLLTQAQDKDFVPPSPGQHQPPSSFVNGKATLSSTPEEPQKPIDSHPSPGISRDFDSPGASSTQELADAHSISNGGSSPSSYPFLTQPAPPLEAPSPIPRSVSSSPIPAVPSHSLGTVGESAPRPFTLSSSTSPAKSSMEPSSTNTLLSDRMKALREQRRASRASVASPPDSTNPGQQPASSLPPVIREEIQAAREGSPLRIHDRSPSTIPAVLPAPIPTKDEMNTSERYETLLPQAQSNSHSVIHQNGTLTGDTTKVQRDPNEDPETANIFRVPVAPSPLQRDGYKELIFYKRDQINAILDNRNLSEEQLSQATQILHQLRDIAMHTDLVNDETESQDAEPERQAQWDIRASAKFNFIKEFLENVSDRNIHIAIAAKGRRLPDMLETFLRGIHVFHRRTIRPNSSAGPDFAAVTQGLKVSIVDLDADVKPQPIQSADVVISVDADVHYQHPAIRTLRKHSGTALMSETNSWSILLVLVLPRTVEHFEYCLQANLAPSTRVRLLLKATRDMQNEAGRLEGSQATVKEAAAMIADYLHSSEAAEWPLVGLSQVEELDSQTDSEVDPLTSSAEASARVDPSELSSVKRPSEAMDPDHAASELSKRPRLESDIEGSQMPPATINPQDIEITHISDSLGRGTQSLDMPQPGSVSVHASQLEQRFKEALRLSEDRAEEYVQALEDLQFRYEDLRNELKQIQRERDAANSTAENAVARMTGAEVNNTSLRAERTQLKEALGVATNKLVDHSVPARAEFEQLRAELETAKLDKDKADKRAEATQKELDYTRSLYQDTSSRSLELAQQNKELERQLAVASKQAEGEQARARSISVQGHNKLLEQEVQKLKQMLKSRDTVLRSKEEEILKIKEASRGRMGTRQSSVPRSPRLGSPIKGRGSRAASPTGDMRGRGSFLNPMRNS